MRLQSARVQNYRSVIDTGTFEVEADKTIMVGPNEAGKTAVLQALQQLNPPEGHKGFDSLRDYPRRLYNDISSGRVKPSTVPVVTATFVLDDDDRAAIPESVRGCRYTITRYLDNSHTHSLVDVAPVPRFEAIKSDLVRLATHMDGTSANLGTAPETTFAAQLSELTSEWAAATLMGEATTKALRAWLEANIAYVDEDNEKETSRHNALMASLRVAIDRNSACAKLKTWIPVFVLYSNYFRVRPIIHLRHLAQRLASGVMDDEQYDYGNSCLLKLLGFTAEGLAELGEAAAPPPGQPEAMQAYRDKLDNRSYQLNAASVRLTEEIRNVWNPDANRAEADKLKVTADGQYLKVVVEDDLGVEVELDQRSEGFQWLVSFFVVFFAEAADQNSNAILLLDEPGMSLHALKQREFRKTISRLAGANQTIYTTHSPFLVGPDELDLVRVVEMSDRKEGTKVHTAVTSSDPAALLPLQEALGYDLAQSLFAQQRNLILEGLTDYWYVDAVSQLFADAGLSNIGDKVALIPSNTASKVVYFATILHAQSLKVAALLDSDAAGDQAAKQETLVHTLGQKRVLRTKDFALGAVDKPEIEDLLRVTLPKVAKAELGWDLGTALNDSPQVSLAKLYEKGIPEFSKYRLAKAFMRWCRANAADDLDATEREGWSKLFSGISSALK